MINRKLPIILLILLLALTLSSCDNRPLSTAVPSIPAFTAAVTPENTVEDIKAGALTFRITWKNYSGRGEAIGKIVNSYNKTHPDDFTVSIVNGDEDLETIQGFIKSDPETVFVLPYRYVKYLSGKGYLADLSEKYSDLSGLFYPAIWELGTVNDVTYGVPWLGHSMCLLYNKTLLDKAGVRVGDIADLDSLVEALRAVEQKTKARGIGLVGADSNDVSWMVNQFIYGFGSRLVSGDGMTVTINNEKSQAALAYYKDVLGDHAQPDWVNDTGVEVMAAFRNQEVAFEIQGIWGVTDIQKNGSPFEVGILSMKDIGLYSEAGPMMLSIPAGMSEIGKREAEKFIRYMTSTEAQEAIMNGEYSPEHDAYYPFRTPIRLDMADSRIFAEYPEYYQFIEGFENPSIDVPVPVWQTIKDQYYETGLHQVMNGDMTIENFLIMIEKEGNILLNEQ